MRTHVVAALAALLVAASACERQGDAGRDTGTVGDTAGGLGRAPAADTATSIHITHERHADLTGDGGEERITVRASGPRYDSLEVRLEIHSATGAPLYSTGWNSALYFMYVGDERGTPAEVERVVRAHLDSLFGSRAFGRGIRTAAFDTAHALRDMREMVRHDVAAQLWREAHEAPAGTPVPGALVDSVRRAGVPAERVDALVRELRDRPWFRYFAGGEATYVIAWSPRERRFVTIYACC